MSPFRFSLASLVGIVILLSVGLAALRSGERRSGGWYFHYNAWCSSRIDHRSVGHSMAPPRLLEWFRNLWLTYSILALSHKFSDPIGQHLVTSKLLIAL